MTPELKKELIQALDQTWRTIGHDILECGDESVISRETVMECVLDYVYIHGSTNMNRSKELSKILFDMDEKERKELMLEAFPFETYGY